MEFGNVRNNRSKDSVSYYYRQILHFVFVFVCLAFLMGSKAKMIDH